MQVIKHQDCHTYVLRDDKEYPVCSAQVIFHQNKYWLCFVATKPSHRRQGYARELVLYIQDEFLDLGEPLYLTVEPDNQHDLEWLRSFYHDCGFKTVPWRYSGQEVMMFSSQIKEMTSVDMVAEFHRSFGFPCPGEPTTYGQEVDMLRYRLIQEELDELGTAMASNNMIGILDALCDLRYVVDGAAVTFGLADVYEEAFREVHRSNMTKACQDRDHAEQEVKDAGMEGERIGLHWVYDCGVYSLRNAQGKLIKPSTYEPAQLEQFICPSVVDDDKSLVEYLDRISELEQVDPTDGDESGARD